MLGKRFHESERGQNNHEWSSVMCKYIISLLFVAALLLPATSGVQAGTTQNSIDPGIVKTLADENTSSSNTSSLNAKREVYFPKESSQRLATGRDSCQTVYYYDDTCTYGYAWPLPQDSSDWFAVRFNSSDGSYCCTLTTLRVKLYRPFMTGTPDLQIGVFDDDGFGLPGTLLATETVGYADLPPENFGWAEADFAPMVFPPSEEFHIGITTIGGEGDTLWALSDAGTGPHAGEDRSETHNPDDGLWYTLNGFYGYDFVFMIEADMCCASIECVPPPSGMVAWWTLDEASGPTADDIAGSVNNSGTWMNSPVPVPGKVDGALSFNGSNSVDVPDDAELNFGTDDFSIDLWIKTTSASGASPIVDKRAGTVPNITGYLLYLYNGCLGSQIGDGSGYFSWTTTEFVADGNWHHIAVTVDRDNPSGWLYYVDGVAVGTPVNPTAYQGSLTNTAPFVIARNLVSPSHTFAGTLDEIDLFNRVLDPLEIQSIWAADSFGKCKDTCHANGDANGDAIPLAVADLVYLTDFIHGCGPAPVPLYSCDLTGDGYVNQADIDLFNNYFIYGMSVFTNGYPVPCPCDPIAQPVPDTVFFGGWEHVSEGTACLAVVDDTLRATRLAGNQASGFSIDLMGLCDEWQCDVENYDPDSSLPLGTQLQTTIRGETDGVPDQLLGTVTETKIGPDEWKVAVDLGASTYTVRIFDGESLVYEQSGIPAEYVNNCFRRRGPFRGYSNRFIRWHVQGATSNRIWRSEGSGPGGSVTFPEVGVYDMSMTQIEIQTEGPGFEDGPLSRVTVWTTGLPQIEMSHESARLAIGYFHNKGLDYLALHDPLQGERVFVSLDEYNQMMDTLAAYLVYEAGFDQAAVDSAIGGIPTMEEMGMLFEMNDTTYIGAPVVTNEYCPYVMQYLVTNGLITQAVADAINTVNDMIVGEDDPDSVLAYVVDVLPDMDWAADEQIAIDAFSSVFDYSNNYWNSDVDPGAELGRFWKVLCDAVGGAIGVAAGLVITGNPVIAVASGVVCANLGSDAADQGAASTALVAPIDSLEYGDPPAWFTAIGTGALDLAGSKLVVYNCALDGEYGVEMDLGEAPRMDAVWNDLDTDSAAENGAYYSITKYGGGDGFTDQIASTFEAVKSGTEWGLSADFSAVGATTLSLVAVLEDSVIDFDTGYVAPNIWWPQPPDDDHWPSPWPLPGPWPFPDYKDGAKMGTGSNGCWPTEDDGPFPFMFPASPSKGSSDIVIADCVGFVPEDATYDFDYLSSVEFRLSGMSEIVFNSITTQVTSCCVGIRGNVDGDDEDIVDISDLVYLVDYMFTGGPPPPCEEETDMNGDGSIDIADLVYLVDYMFNSGPAPVPCDYTPPPAKVGSQQADISFGLEYDNDISTVVMNTPIDLRGIQLELKGTGPTPANLVGDHVDMIHGRDGRVVKVGLLDLNGGEIIRADTREVVRFEGKYTLEAVIVADVNARSITPTIGSALKQNELPTVYTLSQNYPNPFNPSTSISFALPEAAEVRLEVFNLLGQRVTTLLNQRLEAGNHTAEWNSQNELGQTVASGVYFYRLETPRFTESKKMVLLK